VHYSPIALQTSLVRGYAAARTKAQNQSPATASILTTALHVNVWF